MGGLWDFIEEEIWDPIVDEVLEPVANLLGFEDEVISNVAASSVPLYPDEVDDPTVSMIFDHAINGKPLIAGIRRELYNGSIRNLNRFYNYGLNHYTHGVPTASLTYSRRYNTALDTVLTDIAGEAVTVYDTYLVAAPTPNHLIQYYLQENSGYLLSTNKVVISGVNWDYTGYDINGTDTAYIAHLSNSVTTTITVTSEVTIVTSGGNETTTTFERTITSVDNGTTIDNTTVDSTPVVEVGPDVGGVNDGTFSYPLFQDINTVLDIMDYPTEIPKAGTGRYYTVFYVLDSLPSENLIWVYQADLGTYPDLNLAPPTGSDSIKMLPVVPIRQNFTTLSDTPPNAEYDTTFGILNLLSISLRDQIETLNSNESVNQIEAAFVHFGIPIYTQTDYGMECLFDLFNVLALDSVTTKADFDVVDRLKPVNVMTVKENSFNVAVKYNYVTNTTKTGTIGDVGEFTNNHTVLPDVGYTYNDPDSYDGTSTGRYAASYITLQKQLTSTTYAEIIVHGIILVHLIPAIEDVKAFTAVLSDEDSEQGKFIIPIGLEQLNNLDRDTSSGIIRESCHLTFYAREDVFVKWYESNSFLSFIGVLGKAIAIISIFYGGSNTSTYLWNLGRTLLINAALGELLVQGLESADNDLEKGAYIAAYITATIYFNSPTGSLEIANSQQFLNFVAVTTAALSTSIQVDMESLTEEQDALDELYEERLEDIQDLEDELNPDQALSAAEVYALVAFNPNESVEDYYDRVAHSSNPGIKALDEIETFVAQATQLPRYEYNM